MTIPWRLRQYQDVFSSLYEKSNEDTRVSIDHRLDILVEKGRECKYPYTKHLRNGIFEFRAKNCRFLFYFGSEREIVFVYALIKKRSEVGDAAISIAEDRRASIGKGEADTNELRI